MKFLLGYAKRGGGMFGYYLYLFIYFKLRINFSNVTFYLLALKVLMMTSLLNKQTYFRDCFVGEYPILLKSLMKPMTWFVEVVHILKYSRS